MTHKDMAYSTSLDLFAVVSATSEIKVFKLGPPAKAAVGKELILDRLMTLVDHKQEVIAVSMHGNLCASIAKDRKVVINRLDKNFKQSTLVFSMTLDESAVNDTTRVAVCDSEQVYFAIAYNGTMLQVYQLTSEGRAVVVLGIEGKGIHNCQTID